MNLYMTKNTTKSADNYFARAMFDSVRVKKRGKQIPISIPTMGSGHPDAINLAREALPDVNIIGAAQLNLNSIRKALEMKNSVVCLVQYPFKPGIDTNSQFVVVKKLSDRRNEVTFYEYATGKVHKIQLIEFLMSWFGNVNGTHLPKYCLFLKRREHEKTPLKKSKKR